MKYPLSIAALFLLAGCSDSGAVKDAVTERLKDAGSAEFGEITIVDGVAGKFACASINARNSFGGYTGEQQITLTDLGGEGWVWVDEGAEVTHQSCVNIITQMANNDNAEADAEQAARDAREAGAEAAASGTDISQAGAEVVP